MLKNILRKLILNYKKTALALGGLSALAFPPIYAFLLFVISFCVSFKIADNLDSYKKNCLFGYWFGFAYFITGFYWIANALLVDVLTFGWLYPITLIAIGGFFGLFFIPCFAVWFYFRNNNVWNKVLSFACVWVLLEWLRSFLFTGFPWNMLGTIFAFNDIFIQSASIWGTYGLSFIAIILTGSIYACFNKYKKSGVMVCLGIIAFISIFGILRINKYQQFNSDIKVRLVQPSIPQNLKWDRRSLEENFLEYIKLSKQDNHNEVDFVVWGETSLPFDIEHNRKYKNLIKEAIPDNGYLITGVVRYDEDYHAYNSMYVLDNNANIINFYDKNHLVPFGEYIPFRQYLPSIVRPIANNIADFSIGEKYKKIKVDNYPPFGALVCYEIIFPDEIINRNDKPNWLVVLSNDGWYGKSTGPYQHLVSAKMRAIEEGITVVRSANSGISAVINPIGQIIEQIGLHEKGYIDIFLPKELNLYTVYGKGVKSGLILSICLILFILLLTPHSCMLLKIQNKS